MNSQLVLQVLAASGLAGILGAVVNGFINRRKLGAEATQIITNAASGVVTQLQTEITRKDTELEEMREDLRQLRRIVDRNEEEMHLLREALQVHAVWDHKAIRAIDAAKAQGCDVPELPNPPTLWPERRSVERTDTPSNN